MIPLYLFAACEDDQHEGEEQEVVRNEESKEAPKGAGCIL